MQAKGMFRDLRVFVLGAVLGLFITSFWYNAAILRPMSSITSTATIGESGTNTKEFNTTGTSPLTTSNGASIKSTPESITEASSSEGKVACIAPKLEVWYPSVEHARKKLATWGAVKKCAKTPDWTYTQNGTFYISTSRPSATCEVEYLYFKNDLYTGLSASVNITNGTDVDHPYMKVTCLDNGTKYSNFHAAAAKLNFTDIPYVKRGPEHMNVLLVYFDAVSRPHMHRLVPKMHEYVVNELQGVELTGRNVLGDGTAAAILPLLTGLNNDGPGDELNCTRKGNSKCIHQVDDHPFIWKKLRKQGYIPIYAEDNPGLWVWLRKGFKKPPMEHYMRPFYLKAPSDCVGEKSTLKVTMDYFTDLYQSYSHRPLFSYIHTSNLCHDKMLDLRYEDTTLVAWLKQMKTTGALNHTILIIASDHGARYATLRNTPQGRAEEYQPYGNIVLPPWFWKKYPEYRKNLERNAPFLSTSYDLRETILHVVEGSSYKRSNNRGYSLFTPIPKNRTCANAHIPKSYCSCVQWVKVNLTSPIVQTGIDQTLDSINVKTKLLRDRCAVQQLNRTLSVRTLKTFKNLPVYEVRIETQPAGSIYENTMQYDPVKKAFVAGPYDSLVITTPYAKNIGCLKDTERKYSPYCVCKTPA